MTRVQLKILVENIQGLYVATGRDDYGVVGKAKSTERGIAIKAAKHKCLETLGMTDTEVTFTVENLA